MNSLTPNPFWRLFIALPVPPAVKQEVLRTQAELRRGLGSGEIRWTAAEQFHVTLRFLGNVDPVRVESLIAALQSVCAEAAPFRLQVGQVGFFPPGQRPRVVWVGLHESEGRLAAFQTAVARVVQDYAEKAEDHPFSGHLTLGRIKNLPSTEARALTQRAQALSQRVLGEWTADHLELIRSELRPQGSHYTGVATLPFLKSEI